MKHSREYGGNRLPPHGSASGKDVGGVSRSTNSVATTGSRGRYYGNSPPPGSNPGIGGTSGNKQP